MIDPRSPPGGDDDVSLASLFSAERRHPGPPPGAETRVRAAIAASIAGAAIGSGAAAATSGAVASTSAATAASSTAALSGSSAVVGTSLAAKLSGAGVVVVALAATGGGALFVSSYEPPPSATTIAVAPEQPTPPAGLIVDATPTTPAPETATTPATTSTTATVRSSAIEVPRRKARVTDIDSAAVAPVPVAAAVTAPVVVDEPARVAALAAERRQLGFARAALTAGNGRQAMVLLEGHRAAWPEGQLVEEREALSVLSLAHLGRTADARAAATTFRARFPKSLFVDAIDRAVGR